MINLTTNVLTPDYRHDAEYFWPEKEDMQGSTAVWPANVGGIQLALSQKGKHRSCTSLYNYTTTMSRKGNRFFPKCSDNAPNPPAKNVILNPFTRRRGSRQCIHQSIINFLCLSQPPPLPPPSSSSFVLLLPISDVAKIFLLEKYQPGLRPGRDEGILFSTPG